MAGFVNLTFFFKEQRALAFNRYEHWPLSLSLRTILFLFDGKIKEVFT